jgi:tRNA splicing endonuclease
MKEGVCITAAIKEDRTEMEYSPKMKEAEEKIKELRIRLAESLEIDEAHRKQMGKLQARLTEVEEDNKKLAHQVENLKLNHVRKAGL